MSMTEPEYLEVCESFELAMRAEGISENVIETIRMTVDDAVGNNMECDENA